MGAVANKLERQRSWTHQKPWFVELHGAVSGVVSEEKEAEPQKMLLSRRFKEEAAKKAESHMSSLILQGQLFQWGDTQDIDPLHVKAVLWGLPDHVSVCS